MLTYHNKYVWIFLLYSIFLTSCRDFVENVPVQGQRVLLYTRDYRLLMDDYNSQCVTYGMGPSLSCDDFEVTSTSGQTFLASNQIASAMYRWAKPFHNDEQNDNDWNRNYANIYTANTVIGGVMGSEGGEDQLKRTVLAEALLHRAFAYFTLVNCYARQYDPATSATDPGVPLLLGTELFVDLTRTPVQQVYAQIIDDAQRSIADLPDRQDINFRPNKPAAYALLSKVYLHMRDFERAEAYADSALEISSALYDYNLSVGGSSYTFPSQFNDVQVYWRKVPSADYRFYQLSGGLLELLQEDDLRFVLFTEPGSAGATIEGFGIVRRDRYSGPPDRLAVGLTANETWLIKAECRARSGDIAGAVDRLNTLRKKRFRPEHYQDLQAADAQQALTLVVQERRREFFGTGLRWFDQRRLNKDAAFAETRTRVLNDEEYTLEPDGNGYVFPLAPILIGQNPEMVPNP